MKELRQRVRSSKERKRIRRRITVVRRDQIEWMAEKAIRQTRYQGLDVEIYWKTAALVHIGLMSQHEFFDGVEAAAERRSLKNPAGYFRTVVSQTLEKRGAELSALLSQIELVEGSD